MLNPTAERCHTLRSDTDRTPTYSPTSTTSSVSHLVQRCVGESPESPDVNPHASEPKNRLPERYFHFKKATTLFRYPQYPPFRHSPRGALRRSKSAAPSRAKV